MSKPRRTIVLLGALLVALEVGCDRTEPADSAAASASGSATSSSARSDAALEAALAEADPYLRVQKVAEVLPTLGPEVLPDLVRRLRASRGGHGAELELLVRFWASYDPRAATTWAFTVAHNRYKNAAIYMAVETWASMDPVAARDGIEKLEVEEPYAYAPKVALVRGWFRKDRDGLERYIQGLDVGPERQTALLLYAVALAHAEGSDALIQWADALPDTDEGFKRSAYFQVATVLAGIDIEKAEHWCDTHCDGPYGMGEMRSVIAVERMGRGQKGDEVLEWLLRAPRLENTDETLVSIYGLWATRDRDAALAWMQQKTQGDAQPGIPLLYGQYAMHLATTSPAEAIEWASRVENPANREDLQVRIARRWRRQDAAAAEAWLAQSTLPDSARESARNLELGDDLPDSASE